MPYTPTDLHSFTTDRSIETGCIRIWWKEQNKQYCSRNWGFPEVPNYGGIILTMSVGEAVILPTKFEAFASIIGAVIFSDYGNIISVQKCVKNAPFSRGGSLGRHGAQSPAATCAIISAALDLGLCDMHVKFEHFRFNDLKAWGWTKRPFSKIKRPLAAMSRDSQPPKVARHKFSIRTTHIPNYSSLDPAVQKP